MPGVTVALAGQPLDAALQRRELLLEAARALEVGSLLRRQQLLHLPHGAEHLLVAQALLGEDKVLPVTRWAAPCPLPSPGRPSPSAALSTKETFLVLSLHNKLRSKVQPPAANMQKLVSAPPDSAIISRWLPNIPRWSPPPEVGVAWHRGCSHSTRGRGLGRVGGATRLWVWSWAGLVVAPPPAASLGRGNWELSGAPIAPYQRGPWCSLCTAGLSGCFKSWDHGGGLCEVPRNPCRMSCRNGGHLNVSTCRCHCPPGYTGRYCQGERLRRAGPCSCVCSAPGLRRDPHPCWLPHRHVAQRGPEPAPGSVSR
uniref:EGF-like domain-containing protein n=1 Tax=Anser brachyrhynchus TaxID=132585 RepID=A0A8B9BGY4_9AVES